MEGKLRGFNGSLEHVARAVQVCIQLGGASVKSQAYVTKFLPYDAIIGWPTLEKLGFGLVNVSVADIVAKGETKPGRVFGKKDVVNLFSQQMRFME